ncbi:mis12-Mtw1 protein family domain-containing protein [Trichoderma breve]|uniref:Mis12-Mtw1 protein family domain-containing protein n=1 Tax=Trichoderma breve TaxID=2034170 RepID=A0A9W9B941_9HYPO|nr:mis12-Mtw1 protein family domain-containing protein [Trichoderma breve]KAJ4856035.1 mis12-Mtw1 protein family domain-containing protein [Trichoderma breve]
MTTIISLRQPLELLSMSDQPVRRSKRQPAADYEQDDDFQFVRKSKKAKTAEEQPVNLPVRKSRGRPSAAAVAARERAVRESIGGDEDVELIAAEPARKSTAAATKKSSSSRRKASSDAVQDEPPAKASKRGTRKSSRVSNEDAALEEEQQPPPRTNGSSTSQSRSKKTSKPKAPPPVTQEVEEDMSIVEETAERPTKIALPMSDTPIINRNKEMRKKGGNGSRRSSLGSRGRRASSLIESGQTAIPHREVSTSAFYKHIEADLLEPRRMKQLLIWCGERALSEKPRGTLNSGAVLGARAIQDQLLKDFASRSDFSDWFNREDKAPKAPVILRPNPRNIELDEKLATLQARIKRLQEEKKAWLAIRKPPPEQPPLFTPKEKEAETITLPDFDLLDPDEGKIRGFLVDETNSFASIRSQTQARLRNIQSSLEFEVDQLADNVHKLEQRVKVAGTEADRVLSLSAVRLREREEKERKRAGTKEMPIMEVLRSLSLILPEGGG